MYKRQAGLRKKYADVQIDYFQSNIEGELIDKIQQVGFDAVSYTHLFYVFQLLLDSRFAQVLSFNPSGRAEQHIGRQGSYGKLLYNSGQMCIRDSGNIKRLSSCHYVYKLYICAIVVLY